MSSFLVRATNRTSMQSAPTATVIQTAMLSIPYLLSRASRVASGAADTGGFSGSPTIVTNDGLTLVTWPYIVPDPTDAATVHSIADTVVSQVSAALARLNDPGTFSSSMWSDIAASDFQITPTAPAPAPEMETVVVTPATPGHPAVTAQRPRTTSTPTSLALPIASPPASSPGILASMGTPTKVGLVILLLGVAYAATRE